MRRARFALSILVLAAGAAAITLGYLNNSSNRGSSASASTVRTSLVAVTKRDLTDSISVDGTLGYGDSSPVTNRLQGTVTWVPGLGSVVDRGQTLYSIDNKPVILMFGDVPAYRDIKQGISDGPDVKELENNLIALGYANSSNLTANGHFDSYDAAAIKRWEKALGLDQDGVVPLGRIVLLPGPVRVSKIAVGLGGSAGPGSPVIEVSSTQRVVTIDLDARRQSLAVVGSAVQVTLPSGTVVSGKISDVGKVATPGSNGGPTTIKVYVTLDDPSKTGTVDQAPVKVTIGSQSHKGVLAVPIAALVSQSGGGYAVEVSTNDRRHLVSVTTGLFAQGMVEISGAGIEEGTLVVVPAQ